LSFRSCYAVIDAEQLGCRQGPLAWRLLRWLVRNADDKTLRVRRSQKRLAAELWVTDRSVRAAIGFWRAKGVLRLIERGGRREQASEYAVDLGALQVFALREQDRLTATINTVTTTTESTGRLP
jgi:hypothetical protein